MTSTPELHFFKDADDFFEAKHDLFCEDYLDECIMGGDCLNHTKINDVEFIHHQDYDGQYCARILNGIQNAEPLIRISSDSISNSNIYFDIFYLNNFQDIEDFYCLKKTQDFIVEGVTLNQIFEVKIKSLDMINDFWLTSSADTALW